MEHALNRIIYRDEEVRNSPSYYFDNRLRIPHGVMVIQLTLSGAAFISDSSAEHMVGKDQAMIFSYGDASCYGYPAGGTVPYRHRFMTFSGSAVWYAFRSLQERFGPVLHLSPDSPSRRLFISLSNPNVNSVICDRYEESSKLYELVMALLRDQSERGQQSDPAMALYEHIHNNFQQPFSLKEFAADHRISREYLSRKFKMQYGMGPASLLREIRMKHACSLIESTLLPVAEVGRQCGYPDLNAFSRTYRNTFNKSPRNTRR